MIFDPTGRMVTLIRDTPGVASITTRVRGGSKAPQDAPPYVVVRRLSSVPWIGNPGTETGEVTTIRYSALCFSAKGADDERLAYVLAGVVHDAVQDHTLISVPVSGGHGLVFRIQVDSVGPALRDPATDEAYVPVQFSVLAGAQVLA